jgi:hypothetical protein
MSTLNQIVRTGAAAYRRSNRASQLKSREATRQYRQQQKQDAILDAAEAVGQYDSYIAVLKTLHKDAADPVNWQQILSDPAPASPERKDNHEQTATHKLKSFKPSFIDNLLGAGPKKVKKLGTQVELARAKDDQQHRDALKQFEEEKLEHALLQKIAGVVLEKKTEGYKDALEYYQPFADISALGSKLDLDLRANNVTIHLQVNGADIIPDYVLSQTSTGKLSKKKMPVTRFQELYQDYVCSAALRVAREAFNLFPVGYVVVNATGNLFDSVTGHTGDKTLLSVVVTPEKLATLNFETIDPSDAMKNFHHHMKFSKSTGFAAVELIDATTLIL